MPDADTQHRAALRVPSRARRGESLLHRDFIDTPSIQLRVISLKLGVTRHATTLSIEAMGHPKFPAQPLALHALLPARLDIHI